MSGTEIFPELDGLREQMPNLKVLSKIGSGGVCSVFEVLDATHDRRVALKIMHRDIVELAGKCEREPEMMQRFHQECRLGVGLPKLGVPRIPEVYTDFKLSGRPAVLMRFIQGTPLNQLAPVTDERAGLALIHQVAETLMYLHEIDVVHGDLTPENTILDNGGTVWILDLGIARTFGNRWPKIIHDERPVYGKAHYTAPEISRDDAMMTRESDLFTMGKFIVFLMTGILPPEDCRLDMDDGYRNLGDDLSALCTDCLSSRPGDRPDSRSLFEIVDRLWREAQPQQTPQEYLGHWQRKDSGRKTVVFHEKPSVTVRLDPPGKVLESTEETDGPGESNDAVPARKTVPNRKLIIGLSAGVMAVLAVIIAWMWILPGGDPVELPAAGSQLNMAPDGSAPDRSAQVPLSDRVLEMAESGDYDRALAVLDREGYGDDEYLVRLVKAARETDRPGSDERVGEK